MKRKLRKIFKDKRNTLTEIGTSADSRDIIVLPPSIKDYLEDDFQAYIPAFKLAVVFTTLWVRFKYKFTKKPIYHGYRYHGYSSYYKPEPMYSPIKESRYVRFKKYVKNKWARFKARFQRKPKTEAEYESLYYSYSNSSLNNLAYNAQSEIHRIIKCYSQYDLTSFNNDSKKINKLFTDLTTFFNKLFNEDYNYGREASLHELKTLPPTLLSKLPDPCKLNWKKLEYKSVKVYLTKLTRTLENALNTYFAENSKLVCGRRQPHKWLDVYDRVNWKYFTWEVSPEIENIYLPSERVLEISKETQKTLEHPEAKIKQAYVEYQEDVKKAFEKIKLT